MNVSLDLLLLILRVLIALALYAFLATLLFFIWRDVNAAGESTGKRTYPRGWLVVMTCEDVPLQVGQEFPLEPLTTIGRGPTNTIVLEDSTTSIFHAQIVLSRGQWCLTDQESRNGTSINDMPVSDEVVLSPGDVIEIGRVRLVFQSS
jgi:hypothetical protein